jgi:hypothetical protein
VWWAPNREYSLAPPLPGLHPQALLQQSLLFAEPKDKADHVAKMILANKKVHDALSPASKQRMHWQVQPALQ